MLLSRILITKKLFNMNMASSAIGRDKYNANIIYCISSYMYLLKNVVSWSAIGYFMQDLINTSNM